MGGVAGDGRAAAGLNGKIGKNICVFCMSESWILSTFAANL